VDMKKEIAYFHYVSIIFPSTFYLAANKEISSRGYKNVIAFYEYAIKTKGEFMDFYRQKRYPDEDKRKTSPNPPLQKKENIESFIKEDEDIFLGKSGLPYHFAWGILTTCSWILLMFVVSYFSYIKALFRVPQKKVAGLDELEIKLTGGESNVVLSRGKNVYNHFYNVLYGKNRVFEGKIFLDGKNIVREKNKKDFLYICHAEDIPIYIKTGDFVSFLARASGITKKELTQLKQQFNINELGSKYFKELEKKDKGPILLEMALLKKSKVYLIYDFAAGMPPDFLKGFIDRLEKLKKEGPAIIYLTDDYFLAPKIGDTISALKKDEI
jgi:ABC-2 type transport system ATP-binding protein